MILQIIAVRDRQANIYGQPQAVPNIGAAVRGFGDEINRADKQNTMFMHPEDFDLYHLGSYDDNTGRIEQFDQPKQIAVGANYRQQHLAANPDR